MFPRTQIPRVPRLSELPSRIRDFWERSATNKIIVVCVLIFAAQQLNLFCAKSLMLNAFWIEQGFLLNFLTYGVLHGGFWHIVLNMLALYFGGNAVERYDSRGNALAVFFGGTVAGGLVWFALTAGIAVNPAVHTLVGASAGIAAVYAYFSVAYRNFEIKALIFFLIPVKMRALMIFAALAVLSLAGLFFSEIPALRATEASTQTIAHSAHIGGLLFGAVFALAAERLRERSGNVRYFRR